MNRLVVLSTVLIGASASLAYGLAPRLCDHKNKCTQAGTASVCSAPAIATAPSLVAVQSPCTAGTLTTAAVASPASGGGRASAPACCATGGVASGGACASTGAFAATAPAVALGGGVSTSPSHAFAVCGNGSGHAASKGQGGVASGVYTLGDDSVMVVGGGEGGTEVHALAPVTAIVPSQQGHARVVAPVNGFTYRLATPQQPAQMGRVRPLTARSHNDRDCTPDREAISRAQALVREQMQKAQGELRRAQTEMRERLREQQGVRQDVERQVREAMRQAELQMAEAQRQVERANADGRIGAMQGMLGRRSPSSNDEYTRQLERRVAELERQLAERDRAESGGRREKEKDKVKAERKRAQAGGVKWRIGEADSSDDGPDAFGRADEDSDDEPCEASEVAEDDEGFDANMDDMADDFAEMATAFEPLSELGDWSFDAPPPPPDAPDADEAPEAPEAAEAPEPPEESEDFFLPALGYTGAAAVPSIGGAGELHEMMQELRDEVRELRDSLRELRERMQSMAHDQMR